MKVLKYYLLIAFLSASLLAESIGLGNNVFYGDDGAINIAADAGVAVQNLDSPYVMFMLYMGVDKGVSADISRDNVVLVYNDKEYKMPDLKEFRENYKQERRDTHLYAVFGKDFLVTSDTRVYLSRFHGDFFPELGSLILLRDQVSMSGRYGFKSKAYFKNPGFSPGDVVTIKVRDRKNPDIWGEVTVKMSY